MSGYAGQVKNGFVLNTGALGVQYYTIPSFVDAGFDRHCFTTRIGGVSPGEFATLNLSISREENKANKEENYRRVCNVLGVPYESLTLVNYAHGIGVHVAGEDDAGKGISRATDFEPCDAMVTNVPQVTALTLHADCVPLFFADTANRAAGVAHAGWKGVYGGMAAEVIGKMRDAYGTRTENLLVGIGPHITACCFEVQEDVAGKFRETFGTGVVLERGEKLFVSLQGALLEQLERCGVPAQNVTCANLCTYCDAEHFYSHRRDNGYTGAMGAFITVGD